MYTTLGVVCIIVGIANVWFCVANKKKVNDYVSSIMYFVVGFFAFGMFAEAEIYFKIYLIFSVVTETIALIICGTSLLFCKKAKPELLEEKTKEKLLIVKKNYPMMCIDTLTDLFALLLLF